MLDKINKVIKLQKELHEDYSIISTDDIGVFGKRVHVHDLDKFLDISDKPIKVEVRNNEEYAYELSYKALDITFFNIASEEEFQALKNSPAATRLKKRTTIK